MKKTTREKIEFILFYQVDLDVYRLLNNCLNIMTDKQIDELYNEHGYEEDYEEALRDYKEDEEYYD